MEIPLDRRRHVVNGTEFILPLKYEFIRPLGTGAYGAVCAFRDLEDGMTVAIKKVVAFDDAMDARRTLREIMLLRSLRHENLLSIKYIVPPIDYDAYEPIYIVSEAMDADLLQIVKSPQALTDDHTKYFIYQVLRGLKYLHSANVLHRDLKPNNLLVLKNCDLKICDFGLARVKAEREDDRDASMTQYVVTRWYRAPELILCLGNYDFAIDIWSVGCILSELILRKPLFPGKDYVNQIELIIGCLGTPNDADVVRMSGSEKALRYVRAMPKTEGVPLESLFPGANPLAVDLVKKMLRFNPWERISAAEALEHPYLKEHHFPDDEPVAGAPFSFDFENGELSMENLRGVCLYILTNHDNADLIYTEINHYQDMM